MIDDDEHYDDDDYDDYIDAYPYMDDLTYISNRIAVRYGFGPTLRIGTIWLKDF